MEPRKFQRLYEMQNPSCSRSKAEECSLEQGWIFHDVFHMLSVLYTGKFMSGLVKCKACI